MCKDSDNYIPVHSLNEKDIEIDTFNLEDLTQIIKLDERAVGSERRKLLVNRIEQAKECLVVKDSYWNNYRLWVFYFRIDQPNLRYLVM
jgi:hypothetical protein